MVLPVPNFTKLANADYYYVHISCDEFHLHQTIHVEIMVRNPFTFVIKVGLTLHIFSRSLLPFRRYMAMNISCIKCCPNWTKNIENTDKISFKTTLLSKSCFTQSIFTNPVTAQQNSWRLFCTEFPQNYFLEVWKRRVEIYLRPEVKHDCHCAGFHEIYYYSTNYS